MEVHKELFKRSSLSVAGGVVDAELYVAPSMRSKGEDEIQEVFTNAYSGRGRGVGKKFEHEPSVSSTHSGRSGLTADEKTSSRARGVTSHNSKFEHAPSGVSSAHSMQSGRSTLPAEHAMSSSSINSRRSTFDAKSESTENLRTATVRTPRGVCTMYKQRVWLLDATCVCGKPKRHDDHVRLQPCAACGEHFSALDNKRPACRHYTGKPVFISDEKHGQKLYAWSCCPKQHGFAKSIGEFLQQGLPHGCHV
mmetsp:Transcript_38753/g.91491  ORF Transcript_38753/g.91491 Transcript_38753/m.91491 type:complete len:251 (+) Transcript_38753:168-920(+)